MKVSQCKNPTELVIKEGFGLLKIYRLFGKSLVGNELAEFREVLLELVRRSGHFGVQRECFRFKDTLFLLPPFGSKNGSVDVLEVHE
jgi:hypothetical protein